MPKIFIVKIVTLYAVSIATINYTYWQQNTKLEQIWTKKMPKIIFYIMSQTILY